MTLLDLKLDTIAVVSTVGGGKHARMRLDGLGLREGKRIRVLKAAPFHGPLLVEDVTSGARMMLGRGMAKNVEVRDDGNP